MVLINQRQEIISNNKRLESQGGKLSDNTF